MQTKRLLITAANTDYGKTHLTLQLLDSLAARGLRVGAVKPIETGVETLPQDGNRLFQKCRELNPGFSAITLDDVVPVQFSLPAAPAIARGETPIDYERIRQAVERVESVSDVVLIESAGGIMTPIDDTTFVIDLAHQLNARVLFFTTDKLGTISESLVHHEFLANRGIPFHWGINRFGSKELFDTISRGFLAKLNRPLYLFPEDCEAFVDEVLA